MPASASTRQSAAEPAPTSAVDTEATTLFMLSDHVRDALTVLARTSLLPADIQGRVNNTLSAAEEEVFEPEAEVAAAGQIVQGPKLERDDENEKDEEGEKDGNTSSDRIALAPPRVRRPPTVSADLLDEISAWAAQHDAELTSAGIDSADFGLIALLAGTTVYLAPRQRALARVAERNAEEKPNPYLPRHMSPHPPSLGSEYRQLLRTLSKVLNVLFSIFGAGGAAYAAATSTGWARSEGLVLAIVVAVVVGVAELGLWLIYARRGAVRRVEEGQRRVRENTGSARLPGTEAVPLELEENAQDDEARVLAELGEDAAPIPPPKTNIRLRRRAIGAKDEN